MSYLRGHYYVWTGGDDERETLHIWVDPTMKHWAENGDPQGDRVEIPFPVFDSLVVMRAAQLVADGEWEAAVKRTAESESGNFGSIDLLNLLGIDLIGQMGDDMAKSRREHLAICRDERGDCDKPGLHIKRHAPRRR